MGEINLGADQEEMVEDMITIKNLTEEALLENIKMRFDANLIYTYTGTILVSVNPYQMLPIYDAATIQRYAGVPMGSLPPHVFAVADESYRAMLDTGNQSILISGESGSGKTEATKLIMQYLASITSKHSKVEQQILDTNPILEAFGNAKTVRNNNSSRFGKYIRIHFDDKGHIVGANINQYLLEKSRITFQSEDERNYHSFYQLCVGSSEEEKKEFHLLAPEEFHYINQSGCTTIDGMDDAEEYAASRKALDVLGLPPDEQKSIFRILAAVLWIGNITFGYPKDEDGTEDDERSEVTNKDAVKYAAELLKVDTESLERELTTRKIKSGIEWVTANQKVNQAIDTRDALAKAVYSKLFEWMVERINKCIGADPNLQFIGILDIFGFENFKHNVFEQFCINYANEKLHQHFNQYIFKLEQQVYNAEGINWSKIDFKDNEECVSLIEKKAEGMLGMLDEECRVPRGSDAGYVDKMHDKLAKHPHYIRPKMRQPCQFGVKHYAGAVEYDAHNSLEKNRDTLLQGLTELLQKSECIIMQQIFPVEKASKAPAGGGGGRRGGRGGGARQMTIAMKFKTQLNELMEMMGKTHPHYVRCIKPNTKKAPVFFEDELVTLQLRYSGMLDTIRIRRSGYPVRYEFDRFWKRYRLISPNVVMDKADPGKSCREVLEQCWGKLENVDDDDYQVGKTRVFFRDSVMSSLDVLRDVVLSVSALKIQRIFRGWREKHRYTMMKAASLKIQARVRCFQARQQYLELKASAITAQRIYRGYKKRDTYRKLKKSAIIAAKNCRMVNKRRRFLKERNAAIRIETTVRAFFPRRRFRMMRRAVVPIQTQCRMSRLRWRFIRARFSARRIQRWYRLYCAARKIQTMVRAYFPRTKYRKMRTGAIKIQAWYRMLPPRRRYKIVRRAARKIQLIVHRWLWAKHYAERCDAAALQLQKSIRRFLAQNRYQKLRKAALTAQTWRRRAVKRRLYLAQKSAALMIQKHERGRQMHVAYTKQRSAALKLQTNERTRQASKRYRKICKGTLKLQALARMRAQKSRYQKLLKSTILAQSIFRMFTTRSQHVRVRTSTLRIQAWFRLRINKKGLGALLLAAGMRHKMASMSFETLRNAAVTIQSLVKMHVQRKKYVTWRAALRIQCIARMYNQRKNFVVIWKEHKESVARLKMQCFARMAICRAEYVIVRDKSRKTKAEAAYQKKAALAACKIQTIVRGHLCRLVLKRTRNAASTIQRCFRIHLGRLRRKRLLHAVCRLQGCYRKLGVRKWFLKIIRGVSKVQARLKGKMQRRAYKRLLRARPAADTEADFTVEDYTMYKMEDFADAHFQSQWVGIRSKKRQVKSSELISFTRDPITVPHLKLGKEPPGLDDDAIDVFSSLQKYMGDQFAKRNPERWCREVIRTGIEREQLRDEMYCQLCRQLTNNETSESIKRGWELMTICCGCFPPVEKELVNYLRGFFQRNEKVEKKKKAKLTAKEKEADELLSEVAAQSRFGHRRLARTMLNGPRKTIPGRAEIIATCRREPMMLEVRAQGISDPIDTFVDSTTTIGELQAKVAREAGLRGGTWGYALYPRKVSSGTVTEDSSTRLPDLAISPKKHVLDVIHAESKTTQDETTLKAGDYMIVRGSTQLVLSKRLYLASECEALAEPGSNGMRAKGGQVDTIKLLYQHANQRVYGFTQVCGASCDDVSVLSACQLRVANVAVDSKLSVSDMKRHIPAAVWEFWEEDEWKESILKSWKKHALKDCTVPDAQLAFLKRCSSLPLYGAQLLCGVLIVSELRDNMLPPQCYVAISEQGVSFHVRTVARIDEEDADYSIQRYGVDTQSAGFGFTHLETWEFRPADENDLRDATPDSSDDESDAGEKSSGTESILSFMIRENPLDRRVPPRKVDVLIIPTKGHPDAMASLSLLDEYKTVLSEQAKQAIARQDHNVSDSMLLSFKKGDIIQIINKDSETGWFEGELNGATGFFPRAAVDLFLGGEQLDGGKEEEPQAMGRRSGSQVVMARGRGSTVMPYKPEGTAEDDFSLISLAKNHFRESDSGGGGFSFKRFFGPSPEDLTSYTADPVKHSLLKLGEENDTLDTEAIQNFCEVMRYMGDYPMEQSKGSHADEFGEVLQEALNTPDLLAQAIVQRGLDHPQLRNEIFFQICRQAVRNPRPEAITHAWELLAICGGCFMLDPDFMKYFRAGFLHGKSRDSKIEQFSLEDGAQWAEFVQLRLRRTSFNGLRSRPPSTAEMGAIRERRPAVIPVWLPGEKTQTFMADSATTVKEAIQGLARSVGLRSSGGYTLYASADEKIEGGQSLRDSDHLMDFYYAHERQQRASGKFSRFGFVFKRKLFLPQYDDMSNPASCELHYLQLRHSVLSGLFPCTDEDVCMLAAYQLTAEIFTEGKKQKDQKAHLKAVRELLEDEVLEHIPSSLVSKYSDSKWIKMIMKKVEDVKCTSTFLAQMMYVKHLRLWQFYGATVFPVQAEISEFTDAVSKDEVASEKSVDEEDVSDLSSESSLSSLEEMEPTMQFGAQEQETESKPMWLAVHRKGVAILDENSKDPVLEFDYSEILQWVHFDCNWILITGNLLDRRKASFVTDQASELSELVECYSELFQEERRKQDEANGVVAKAHFMDMDEMQARASRQHGKSVHLRALG